MLALGSVWTMVRLVGVESSRRLLMVLMVVTMELLLMLLDHSEELNLFLGGGGLNPL